MTHPHKISPETVEQIQKELQTKLSAENDEAQHVEGAAQDVEPRRKNYMDYLAQRGMVDESGRLTKVEKLGRLRRMEPARPSDADSDSDSDSPLVETEPDPTRLLRELSRIESVLKKAEAAHETNSKDVPRHVATAGKELVDFLRSSRTHLLRPTYKDVKEKYRALLQRQQALNNLIQHVKTEPDPKRLLQELGRIESVLKKAEVALKKNRKDVPRHVATAGEELADFDDRFRAHLRGRTYAHVVAEYNRLRKRNERLNDLIQGPDYETRSFPRKPRRAGVSSRSPLRPVSDILDTVEDELEGMVERVRSGRHRAARKHVDKIGAQLNHFDREFGTSPTAAQPDASDAMARRRNQLAQWTRKLTELLDALDSVEEELNRMRLAVDQERHDAAWGSYDNIEAYLASFVRVFSTVSADAVPNSWCGAVVDRHNQLLGQTNDLTALLQQQLGVGRPHQDGSSASDISGEVSDDKARRRVTFREPLVDVLEYEPHPSEQDEAAQWFADNHTDSAALLQRVVAVFRSNGLDVSERNVALFGPVEALRAPLLVEGQVDPAKVATAANALKEEVAGAQAAAAAFRVAGVPDVVLTKLTSG